MTAKDLRHMSRSELLRLLIIQMEKNEKLEKQLSETQEELNNRTISIKKVGSIAEAALQLNGVFSAAEAAAAEYLNSIAEIKKKEETIYQLMRSNAQEEADSIIAAAKAYSAKIHSETEAYLKQAKGSVYEKVEKKELSC